MTRPKVLVVEDEKYGAEIADALKQDFGFLVCYPRDPQSLAECLSTETFDGAMIDLKLEKGPWKSVRRGQRMSGVTVKNGDDVRRVARKLNADLPAYTYTTVDRPTSEANYHIRKPINPHSGALKRALDEFGDATRQHVRAIGPWVMPYRRYTKLTFNERIQSYNKALSVNASRFKQVFIDLGNVSWLLLADKKIRLCGESLSLHSDGAAPFPTVPRAKFLNQRAITQVAAVSHVFPFPFWNTSKFEYMEKQFELAGPELSRFPSLVRDLFSICVANTCGEAYVAEPDNSLLKWCSKITNEGKIHLSKLVFKELGGIGDPGFSRFVRVSERLTLPRIVEIYDADVSKIDKGKSTAWVELRKCGEERISLVEPFDLKLLTENGIKHQHQKFEYAVYRWPNGGLGMSIELGQDSDRPLFSFLD